MLRITNHKQTIHQTNIAEIEGVSFEVPVRLFDDVKVGDKVRLGLYDYDYLGCNRLGAELVLKKIEKDKFTNKKKYVLEISRISPFFVEGDSVTVGGDSVTLGMGNKNYKFLNSEKDELNLGENTYRKVRVWNCHVWVKVDDSDSRTEEELRADILGRRSIISGLLKLRYIF